MVIAEPEAVNLKKGIAMKRNKLIQLFLILLAVSFIGTTTSFAGNPEKKAAKLERKAEKRARKAWKQYQKRVERITKQAKKSGSRVASNNKATFGGVMQVIADNGALVPFVVDTGVTASEATQEEIDARISENMDGFCQNKLNDENAVATAVVKATPKTISELIDLVGGQNVMVYQLDGPPEQDGGKDMANFNGGIFVGPWGHTQEIASSNLQLQFCPDCTYFNGKEPTTFAWQIECSEPTS